MNRLDVIDKDATIHWLVSRQNQGFHGRVNKIDDTCYAYWIGSSLDIYQLAHLIEDKILDQYLATTLSKYGGYSKVPDCYPDIMHSYMGLAGLSIINKGDLGKMCSPLGTSMKTFQFAKSKGWCQEKLTCLA
jgi:geranylgeranyl transferase type-1 subunit beta